MRNARITDGEDLVFSIMVGTDDRTENQTVSDAQMGQARARKGRHTADLLARLRAAPKAQWRMEGGDER